MYNFIEFIDKFFNSNTVAVIAGALLAGWFGFRQYRSQKIWEKIDERYFKKGIEELIGYLQYLRIRIEHNYSYSLLILKYYKTFDNKKFLEWFDNLKDIKEKGALSAKVPNSYLVTAQILKNENFNKLCMSLFAQVGDINDYYISDCIVSLHTVTQEPERAKLNKEQIFKKLVSEGNKRFDEIDEKLGLYVLIEMLESILLVLRKQNINSYKNLEEVHQNKEIIKLLKKLENIKEVKHENKQTQN